MTAYLMPGFNEPYEKYGKRVIRRKKRMDKSSALLDPAGKLIVIKGDTFEKRDR